MDISKVRLGKEIMEWDNFYALELYEKSAGINPYTKTPEINCRMWEAIRESYSLMEKREEFRDLYNVFNKYWWQESIGRYFRLMQKTRRKPEQKVKYNVSDMLEKFDAIKGAVKEWHEEATGLDGENTSGMLDVKLHKTPTLDRPGMSFDEQKDILEYIRPYLPLS